MRGVVARIRSLGAELVVIGNGNVRQASRFARDEKLEFSLLTDPKRGTYEAAGLRRSIGATLGPALWGNGLRAFKKGFRQQGVQGDPWQQGGVFVVTPSSDVVFSQVSRGAGDHADPREVLSALAAVGGS